MDEFLALLESDLDPLLEGEKDLPNLLYEGRHPDRFEEFRNRPEAIPLRLRAFIEKLEASRTRHLQYDDVRVMVQPTFWNSALPKLDQFVERYIMLGRSLKPDTGKSEFMGLMGTKINDYNEAMAEMTSWRNRVRGDLNDVRRSLTS